MPNHLKQVMNIKKEIVIAGVLNKIELWSKETYDKNLSNLLLGQDTEIDLEVNESQ